MCPDPASQQKPEVTENNKPKTSGLSPSAAVIVYSTYPNAGEAEAMGTALVELGLVACANILAPMTAIYRWKGQRHRDNEVPMLMKTRASLVEQVIAEVKKRHSFETPAILVLPVVAGSPEFLQWIMIQTDGAKGASDNAG